MTCAPTSVSYSCPPTRSSPPSPAMGATASSYPIHSFQTLTGKSHKNRTPRIQCLVLFQQNFVLLTCRFILRFLQIQLPTACWRNSFSPYQRYKIFNTLAINLLGNFQHFPTVPIVQTKRVLGRLCLSLVLDEWIFTRLLYLSIVIDKRFR